MTYIEGETKLGTFADPNFGPTGHNGIQHAEKRQGFINQRSDGLAAKQMDLIPFRLALALQADGWFVRSDICAGLSPLQQSEAGQDRATNPYWKLSPEAFPAAHFAVFPTEIPRRAILAGTSEQGCCPQCGAPALRLGRHGIGIELSETYAEMARKRIREDAPLWNTV